MKTTVAALVLVASAACAAPRASLSVAPLRPLRQVMAQPGAVEASSARQRLFASSAAAVERAQAAEAAEARQLADASGSGGR